MKNLKFESFVTEGSLNSTQLESIQPWFEHFYCGNAIESVFHENMGSF